MGSGVGLKVGLLGLGELDPSIVADAMRVPLLPSSLNRAQNLKGDWIWQFVNSSWRGVMDVLTLL